MQYYCPCFADETGCSIWSRGRPSENQCRSGGCTEAQRALSACFGCGDRVQWLKCGVIWKARLEYRALRRRDRPGTSIHQPHAEGRIPSTTCMAATFTAEQAVPLVIRSIKLLEMKIETYILECSAPLGKQWVEVTKEGLEAP